MKTPSWTSYRTWASARLIENRADALDKLLVTVRLVERDELDLTASLVVAEQRQQLFVPEVLERLAAEDELECSPDRAVGLSQFPAGRRGSRFAARTERGERASAALRLSLRQPRVSVVEISFDSSSNRPLPAVLLDRRRGVVSSHVTLT